MKIFNINTLNKQYNPDFSLKKNQKNTNAPLPFNNYSFKLNTLYSDTVSFGKKNNKVPLIKDGETLMYHRIYSDLKDISNLPCGYCGEVMLSVPNRKRIAKDLSTLKGEALSEAIEKNKKFFRYHKSNVAKKVAQIARNNPEMDIQQAFQKLAPLYITQLETEQLEVVRRLDNLYGQAFDSEEAIKVFQNILYETTQWIKNKSEDEPFKRKAFLEEFKKILSLPLFQKNLQLTKKIYKEAEKMPQSVESESAFVIKYHRRSAREISELMIYEPLSTIEHIKTQESGGLTSPENLSIICAHCNNLVRRNKPMDKFVDEHPEIAENLKKNFDAILAYTRKQNKMLYKKLSEQNIDNENYQRYVQAIKENEASKNYISAIAQTYMRESKGKLDLTSYVN